jgi:hypothetical protein
MSFIVLSPKSFTDSKKEDLISAVIADCQETLEATPEFNNAGYKDSCLCKANLEYVISYIGTAATLDSSIPQSWHTCLKLLISANF